MSLASQKFGLENLRETPNQNTPTHTIIHLVGAGSPRPLPSTSIARHRTVFVLALQLRRAFLTASIIKLHLPKNANFV